MTSYEPNAFFKKSIFVVVVVVGKNVKVQIHLFESWMDMDWNWNMTSVQRQSARKLSNILYDRIDE